MARGWDETLDPGPEWSLGGGEEGGVVTLDINALSLALIPIIAGGIGYLVDRAYKRADARRAEMIELYKKQRDEAEAEAEEARAEVERQRELVLAYWQLLVKNGIEPVPSLTGKGKP